MRGMFVRHDFLRDVLKKICSQAGVVASIEVIVVEKRHKKMAGAVFFEPNTERVGGRVGGQPPDRVVCG